MLDDPTVLLVDDSSNDVLLMRAVFGRVGMAQSLHVAADGDDAIAYLQGDGRYGDRRMFPLPSLLLLDLNMPGKNGFDVLSWIRRRPEFKRLQVYILSASNRPGDIERGYESGANFYLVKPRNLDKLVEIATCLVAWLRLSQFAPPNQVENGSQNGGIDSPAAIQPELLRSMSPLRSK